MRTLATDMYMWDWEQFAAHQRNPLGCKQAKDNIYYEYNRPAKFAIARLTFSSRRVKR